MTDQQKPLTMGMPGKLRGHQPANWIWGYGDRLSGSPGDTVALHAAGTGGTAVIEIARIGKVRAVVAQLPAFAVAPLSVPDDPHINGCGWPEVTRFTIGDWPSGYYELLLTGADGAQARHMLVVRAAERVGRIAFVLATNTYQAYNVWGGASSYVWAGGPWPAPDPADVDHRGPARTLSAQRPFSAGQMQPAASNHRIVSPRARGFQEEPIPGEIHAEAQAGGDIQDLPAGFVDKWEHAFAAWAEDSDYTLDYFTDADLDHDGHPLDGYDVAIVVGHSEYWTWNERAAFDAFVDRGGKLAIFSGNTCYWQCRWEADGTRLVLYKSAAEAEDPVHDDPAQRHLLSGMWSHPATGNPEAELTGLSFLFGGYHRFGNCVARGTCGYTVLREDHWTLAGADLYWGDVFGSASRLVGFECDGAPLTAGADGLPAAVPMLGVPADMDIIAYAPASLFEPEDQPYAPITLPEALPMIARALGVANDAALRQRLRRGHGLMVTFRRGRGAVFNGGTTEWAYGLAGRDPHVDRITRNVLDRFLGEPQ